jgi:hypothetical protein
MKKSEQRQQREQARTLSFHTRMGSLKWRRAVGNLKRALHHAGINKIAERVAGPKK